MYHREYINPYYLEKLDNTELNQFQDYISNLSDSDYSLSEFEHYDGFEDKTYDKYRSCMVHYPKDSSIISRVAKNYFQCLNSQFWRYDLKNHFEFQLVKYDIGLSLIHI